MTLRHDRLSMRALCAALTGLLILTLTEQTTAGQTAEKPDTEQVKWQVLSGGSTTGSGGIYLLTGTVGQTAIGSGTIQNGALLHGYWQDFGSGTCCVARTGDANMQGTYPNEVTLGDVSLLIDVKFISGDCSKLLCLTEADVNQNGLTDPNCAQHVTLADISTLIDFLFITGPATAVLPECL